MIFDVEKDNYKLEPDTETNEQEKHGFAQETLLELVDTEKGQIVLREVSNKKEPLVTIEFSDKVNDMLGGDTQFIGHQMVHAAIQAVMRKQVNQWHANVYDEEPDLYS